MRGVLFFGALIAALLACGGTGDGIAPSAEEPPAAEVVAEFVEMAEEAHCEWAARCFEFEDVAACRSTLRFEDELNLLALASAGWRSIPTKYLLEAVSEGRILFDPDAGAACLDFIRHQTCAWEHTWTADELAGQAGCAAALRGRMERFGPCVYASECAGDDVVCGFDPSCADACCVGICHVREPIPLDRPLGAPCESAKECVRGAFCLNGVCAAEGQVGEPCAADLPCVEEAWCESTEGVGTCAPRLPDGQHCDSDRSCQSGRCAWGPDTRVCIHPVPAGGACDPEWYGSQCRDRYHSCDPERRVCVLRPGPGEPCAGLPCRPSARCEGELCRPRAGVGEACEDSNACLGDLVCYAHTCTAFGVESCPPPEP